MKKKTLAIGVDIGGTSIKGGLINNEGQILARFSLDVEKGEKQEITINKLINALNDFIKNNDLNLEDIIGIGIGVPGAVDTSTGIVSFSNNLDWHDLYLKEMIKKSFNLPIRLLNDANAATYGEAKFGAGKKYKNFLMLTLGTGVGGGIIIDGKLYEGNLGKGAELGHNVVVVDGEECTCGRRGCLEAYASATALIRETKKMMDKDPISKMWEISRNNGKVDGRTAFEAAKQGDKSAQQVVDYYVKYLSEGLLNFFNTFRPEAVVLSGGIAKEGDYLISKLVKYCEDRSYGFKTTPKVDIIVSELGYDAGKIGAAALLFDK